VWITTSPSRSAPCDRNGEQLNQPARVARLLQIEAAQSQGVTHMKRVIALSLVGLTGLVSGCLEQRVYVDPNQNNGFIGNDNGGDDGWEEECYGCGSALTVRNPTIRGDIGPIRGFNSVEATADAYDDADFGTSQVTVQTTEERGWGLVIINLDRSLSTLPAGETRLTGNNNDFSGSYVQLCSDAPDGSVHFDGIAEDVKIVVTDTAAGRDVAIDATISDGFDGSSYNSPEPTTVTTRFTVAR